jgi:sigma-B regulation protein RsbU (phosphoserine phosphatase)
MTRTTSSRTTARSRLIETYTRGVTREEMQRLFTHDTRDAYRFYARAVDHEALKALPRHRRLPLLAQRLFLAFSEKLPPARRAVYGASLVFAAFGLLKLFRGVGVEDVPAAVFSLPLPLPQWAPGTIPLLVGFLLLNLLVLLEVADRLSLKNDLEVAREIQQAMLPHDTYRALGVEVHGQTRPANTVGGDFYDILPLTDGRLVVALGDVAGKGSPAALLMALLLAMLRTLLDEGLEPTQLIERLNLQICRHAPGSRFITLFFALFDPRSGSLTFINAGQTPPLLRRASGAIERLNAGGIALGMLPGSVYESSAVTLDPGDMVVLYSDGITEAESPDGVPFEETGLEAVLHRRADTSAPDVAAEVVKTVELHAQDHRFADDLTIVVLRRLPPPPQAAH